MSSRLVHINGNEWKYKVGKQYVVIHNPDSERHNVSICRLWFSVKGVYPNDSDGKYYVNIGPGIVKEYIEKELV